MGDRDLPPTLVIHDVAYTLVREFKHDFFAATGLYQSAAGQVVLKVGRCTPIWGLPMTWIGRFLADRETALYGVVQSLAGVPRFLGRWKETGIVHEYVRGAPLERNEAVGDDFFPALESLIQSMHQLEVAYVDLEKRENILKGDDGKPYLIDFQISWYLPPNRLGHSLIAVCIRQMLQSSDRYHLLKHWRRMRPDQLTPEQLARSYRPPLWISWHRYLFRPLTMLRRRILVRMGERTSHRIRSPG